MIGPSTRLVLGLVLCAVPWGLALWLPGMEILASLLLMGLVAMVILDLAFLPRRKAFELELRVPQVLSVVEDQAVTVLLRSRIGLTRTVWIRLQFPETWEVAHPLLKVRLAAFREEAIVFRVRPRKRGRYEVGPVHLRAPSPVGFLWKDLRFDVTQEVKIYPAVTAIKKFALLSRRLRTREMGLRLHRQRGQGKEFERLREYHPDDDFRLIDWKASARRGHFISREYQIERCQNIVMMVDAGRMLTEEVDGVVKIEYVLNAALLLTRIAAGYDDRVGAIVFSDRVERSSPLRKGHAAVGAVAETLYDVEPRLCEANYEAAFAHLNIKYRKRALVVLLTNLVDQETSALMTSCLKAVAWRHVPLCVAVGDRETREVAWSVPRNADDFYRKGAAAHLLVSRERTLQDLQRHGVHVIDAPAGHVPVELINKYLELKARQML